MSKKYLYHYAPPENTIAEDGIYSTALKKLKRGQHGGIGWIKYKQRAADDGYPPTREGVMAWLDASIPDFKRSYAVSALPEPIPDDAVPELVAFRNASKLYRIEPAKRLLAEHIISDIWEPRGPGKGMHLKDTSDDPIDWKARIKRKLLFQKIRHYMLQTTDGHIPPEYIKEIPMKYTAVLKLKKSAAEQQTDIRLNAPIVKNLIGDGKPIRSYTYSDLFNKAVGDAQGWQKKMDYWKSLPADTFSKVVNPKQWDREIDRSPEGFVKHIGNGPKVQEVFPGRDTDISDTQTIREVSGMPEAREAVKNTSSWYYPINVLTNDGHKGAEIYTQVDPDNPEWPQQVSEFHEATHALSAGGRHQAGFELPRDNNFYYRHKPHELFVGATGLNAGYQALLNARNNGSIKVSDELGAILDKYPAYGSKEQFISRNNALMQLPEEQWALLGPDGVRALDEYIRDNMHHANSPRNILDFEEHMYSDAQKAYDNSVSYLNTLEAQGYPVADPDTLPWYKRLFMSSNTMDNMRLQRENHDWRLEQARGAVRAHARSLSDSKQELENERKAYEARGGDARTKQAHDKDDKYLDLFNNYFWAQHKPVPRIPSFDLNTQVPT